MVQKVIEELLRPEQIAQEVTRELVEERGDDLAAVDRAEVVTHLDHRRVTSWRGAVGGIVARKIARDEDAIQQRIRELLAEAGIGGDRGHD